MNKTNESTSLHSSTGTEGKGRGGGLLYKILFQSSYICHDLFSGDRWVTKSLYTNDISDRMGIRPQDTRITEAQSMRIRPEYYCGLDNVFVS